MFDFTGAGDTAVAAIAASLATGASLEMAVRIAALAMAVSATQPGIAVAPAADVLAVLTPQGRALRRIVPAEAAIDQVSHWRRGGLKTGLIIAGGTTLPTAALTALSHQCDRLVLGWEGDATLAASLAEDAALAGVDLICVMQAGQAAALLPQMRPDILVGEGIEPGGAALAWGGTAMPLDWLETE